MSERTHRHNREGPCHFSLMSLSATKRLGLVVLPLLVLWGLVVWAGGWPL
ncbi:MAG: hypothetical protein IKE45_03420 [Halomonas sp.]|nr:MULTISPECIES: hypothetical protein [unclassified Halomonas]MBR2513071.1 hypothetical protein [Halomonas sp.]MDP3533950.1 hypothetical protein [Halomonas sp.]WFE70595.1 hypothetical protein P8S55_12480 [Halomonas sp. M1]